MMAALNEHDRDFAGEVRDFVRANLDPKTRAEVLLFQRPEKADRVKWQRALAAKGWGAPGWPVEQGGPGWTVMQRYLFSEILAEEGAPMAPVFGIDMLAPVLMKFGTEAQQRKYLPGILWAEDWWCQGFSEPNAGSDLAALKTKARREGDEFIINGQKIWTTLAHQSTMMFCLVRTSEGSRKQEGISFLLVPMDAPGITVRPIITIDDDHEVNTVFLDDVRVPADHLVGVEGHGWTYAKYLLGQERTSIAKVSQSKRELARLKAMARRRLVAGVPLFDNPLFRTRIIRLEIELQALEITSARMVAAVSNGSATGLEASMLKIKGSELQQAISEALMEAAGETAFRSRALGQPIDPATAWDWQDHPAGLAPTYFNLRKVTIYGGSNEIQREILAKTI